jgi:competence protein ComGC
MANTPEKPVEEAVVEPVTPDQPKEDEKVLETAVETLNEEPEELPVEDDEDEEPIVTAPELGTWQEYVLKNLPNITARIVDAEGKTKTLQVKSDAELPAGFSFVDDAARSQFSRDIAGQEVRAQKLLDEYNQKQVQEQVRQFEVQEAKDVASDLKWLQSNGYIKKFQYAEDDPKFNSDPAVKEANAIYDLYKKTNNEYMRKYMNTNRTFRISYRDAADKYFAQQARQSKDKPADKPVPKIEKTPTEKARDDIARKQGAPQGGDAGAAKPAAFKGMTFDDINRLARMGKI